jgi:prolipoprotein diacylglyceryltransferase
LRHPVQIYEAVLDIALAATLFAIRKQPRIEGHLFRMFLIGYALIRFALDPLRGDERQTLLGLSYVQIACALAALVLAYAMSRARAPQCI